MNRRERYAKITSFQEADRVPVDMGSHVASIHQWTYEKIANQHPEWEFKNTHKILDRMVQNVVPDEQLLERLGVDFRWIAPNWIDVKDVDEGIYEDMWGIHWQYMLDAYSVHDSPLKTATSAEDIANHPWPDPYHPDLFTGLEERAKNLYENTDYILVADSIKGGLLTKALQIRGYEYFFADMANNIPFAEALLDKLLELYKLFWGEFLKRVGPYVATVYFTDDIGGQSSLMISPHTFRTLIKPRLASLIDHIKSCADVKFMYHTDGTITPVLDDIVEMGVNILNPVQTSAMNMDTAALKEQYHGKLCFHGAIDVQQMLPFSSTEEVRYDVAKRLYDLGRGGGYILAPCHNVGSDVPVENVFAMYDAAKELGAYPLTAAADVLRDEDKQGAQIFLEQAPKQAGKVVKRARRPRKR